MNSKPSSPGASPEDNSGFAQMQQVSVYITETDQFEHRPLYLKILELVKGYDAAGATVLKGLAGYSASSHAIHTSHLADIKQSLPLVIVIVDTEEKVTELLPHLEEMIRPNGGLITVQNLEGHCYLHPHKQA
jgi:uncharacterized protein